MSFSLWRHRDPGNQAINPDGLRPPELSVLQIDVVDDLCDRTQGGVVYPEPGEQDLEGAEVALVRELGLEHVEAELASLGTVSLTRHELEPRIRVDDAPDEPGARDPIDVDALPSDPGATTKIFDPLPVHGDGVSSVSSTTHPHLQTGEQALGCLPTRRAEEVDAEHVGESSVQPGDICVDLSAQVFGNLTTARKGVTNSAGFIRDLPVVRITRGVEQSLDLVVPKPIDEGCLAQ